MEKHVNKPKRSKPRSRTSTAEILGSLDLIGSIPSKWAAQHAQLAELRDDLTGSQHARAENAKAESVLTGQHLAEAATDSYDRDWALAMASSDQNLLYDVQDALHRITIGTYGRCELTGKPIEPARLRVIPWTRFCAQAQVELEGRGLINRPHLGKLGSYAQAADDSLSNDESIEELAMAAEEA